MQQKKEMVEYMFNGKIKAELEEVKAELFKMQSDNKSLRISASKHDDVVNKMTIASKKIEKERDELKEIVRKQTGADLLVNALEAVGIIKIEKKDIKRNIDEENRLQLIRNNQAAQYNQKQWAGDLSSLANNISGGGLAGSLFG